MSDSKLLAYATCVLFQIGLRSLMKNLLAVCVSASKNIRMKLLMALVLALCSTPLFADDLSHQFTTPPASARPWVYWFWNNGNVTKAGITADLEAMQRVGIGGVIIMDVVERFAPPPG